MNTSKDADGYSRTLLVNKTDISQIKRVKGEAVDSASLTPGQILVAVEKFALTANNVSYAATGDKFGYWEYFPSDEEGWGIVPVWGYATVIRSEHEDVQPGERLFGYFPMSSHLVMQPEQVKAASFLDQYAHRRDLHPTYNTYFRLQDDPVHFAEYEDWRPGFYGLFVTSFVVDDFMAEHQCFGAEQAILVSASSKTAVTLAFLLKQRLHIKTVGLTSPANKAFVESLNLYDEVLTYDQLQALSPDKPTVCVDFSGNGEVIGSIHEKYQDNLKYSCLIGKSHWQQETVARDRVPGARPRMFWAPDHIARRIEDWGEAEFSLRLLQSWKSFAETAGDFYTLEPVTGEQAVESAYTDVVAGRINPAVTLMCSF